MANIYRECGDALNYWVDIALTYMPAAVLDAYEGPITFLSTPHADAFRIGERYREGEIVLVSERLVPPEHANEGHPEVRYLIFALLHELAHVLLRHRPPNEIEHDENDAQERQADEQALAWFNFHVKQRENPHLLKLTLRDVDEQREKNQRRMTNTSG